MYKKTNKMLVKLVRSIQCLINMTERNMFLLDVKLDYIKTKYLLIVSYH